MDEEFVKILADQHKWRPAVDRGPSKLSFTKGNMRIEVFYNTMTVKTCLPHPKLGKTQMFRRDVDYALLDKIFRNPRVHTDKGYQRNGGGMDIFRENPIK